MNATLSRWMQSGQAAIAATPCHNAKTATSTQLPPGHLIENEGGMVDRHHHTCTTRSFSSQDRYYTSPGAQADLVKAKAIAFVASPAIRAGTLH